MNMIQQQFEREGYAVVRGVLQRKEIVTLCDEADQLRNNKQLMDRRNLRAATRASIEQGDIVDRLDPIIDLSDQFKELSHDPRIVEPVAEILDGPAFLMKDKLIYKFPKATGYSPHQDYSAWVELPAPPEAMLSVLIALDASSAENGALEIYPGLHSRHYLKDQTPSKIYDPNDGMLTPPEMLKGRTTHLIELNAGDIALFSSLAPHKSGSNRSSTFRRHVFFTYSNAIYGDLYDQHYDNLRRYLSKDRAAESMADQYYL